MLVLQGRLPTLRSGKECHCGGAGTSWTLAKQTSGSDTPSRSFQKLIARVEDVSERRRLEEVLWELALVDDLTGLHNRRSFMLLAEQALKEAVRAQRPLISLFLDVDDLKAINDTHGHAEGDRALRLVAGALRAACRDSDIVGRLSGDEFAIILAEAHELDGLEGRVRSRVAQAAEHTDYPLSVSIGVARCGPGEQCSSRRALRARRPGDVRREGGQALPPQRIA